MRSLLETLVLYSSRGVEPAGHDTLVKNHVPLKDKHKSLITKHEPLTSQLDPLLIEIGEAEHLLSGLDDCTAPDDLFTATTEGHAIKPTDSVLQTSPPLAPSPPPVLSNTLATDTLTNTSDARSAVPPKSEL